MKGAKKDSPSYSRLSKFTRGAIVGLSILAGWSASDIASHVPKPDGKPTSVRAVGQTVERALANGGMKWDGESCSSGGRPRETSDALDKAILKLVFKHRGRTVVTAKFVKKKLKAARKVTDRTIQRRLGEAGLKWLRRRRKTFVPVQHYESRLEWCAWVVRRTASTLQRWAYTDGTVFYVARSQVELQHKARAALGPMVWRRTDGKDGLWHDCIGPSVYWKAQGRPVRIWGLLLAGILFIHVLPQGVCMSGQIYAALIRAKFGEWLRRALRKKAQDGVYLVQDHERALWKAEPRRAMREQSLKLLENFPKYSPDFNPIEQAWREVRARLDVTIPDGMEYREDFIRRLHAAVAWVNRNRCDYLSYICGNQKERARDCQNAHPPGSRTKH